VRPASEPVTAASISRTTSAERPASLRRRRSGSGRPAWRRGLVNGRSSISRTGGRSGVVAKADLASYLQFLSECMPRRFVSGRRLPFGRGNLTFPAPGHNNSGIASWRRSARCDGKAAQYKVNIEANSGRITRNGCAPRSASAKKRGRSRHNWPPISRSWPSAVQVPDSAAHRHSRAAWARYRLRARRPQQWALRLRPESSCRRGPRTWPR